jgi:hypothetical protein
MDSYPIAVLRLLDKVTARVEERDVAVNTPTLFGTLQILVHACRQTPPEEMPESSAFLEIGEFKPGELGKNWFSGWMFASNPALSALEHPVYDVWLTSCKNAASKSESGGEPTP